MLPRKPTRIELKPEDKEEYDNLRRIQQQRVVQQQDTDLLLDPQQDKARSVAARIGLRK